MAFRASHARAVGRGTTYSTTSLVQLLQSLADTMTAQNKADASANEAIVAVAMQMPRWAPS